MHAVRMIVVFTLSLSLAYLTFGQKSSSSPEAPFVRMGSVKLSVGMSQEKAIADLARTYRVDRTSGTDESSSWMILTKGTAHLEIHATINFEHGQLTSISRHWTLDDQLSSYEFAFALYRVISSLREEGHNVCTIDAGQAEPFVAGFANQTSILVCGGKEIRIDAILHKGQESATITEMLSNRTISVSD